MSDLDTLHSEMVGSLLNCQPTPGGEWTERARELRVMIRRIELIAPELEQRRTEAMRQKLEQSCQPLHAFHR